jgi:glycosyltransferase involved in cell wall biosynthesis
VIVVDDSSTDETGRVAAEAGARVIRHDHNQGEGAARNTGVAHATHEWVGLLDSDDEWMPHLLGTLWPLREGHVLVAGSAIYRRPGKVSYSGLVGRRPRTIASPASLLYPGCFLSASGILLRADAVRGAGWFPRGWSLGTDLDLWLRMLELGPGVMSPIPVVDYHIHPGQASCDRDGLASAQLRVLRAYADRAWWSGPRVEAWRGVAAWDDVRWRLADGDRRGALVQAAFGARHPLRLAGAAGIVLRRLWMRHRMAELAATGRL